MTWETLERGIWDLLVWDLKVRDLLLCNRTDTKGIECFGPHFAFNCTFEKKESESSSVL